MRFYFNNNRDRSGAIPAARNRAGYALIFAVLVASVVLAVGMAIFNLSSKELLLSSVARDSLSAFYAADSGRECALYWDFAKDAFATSTQGSSITCANQTVTTGSESGDPLSPGTSSRIGGGGVAVPTSTFFVMINGAMAGPCAIVSVTKSYQNSKPANHVESRGYNVCNTWDPLRLERGVMSDNPPQP